MYETIFALNSGSVMIPLAIASCIAHRDAQYLLRLDDQEVDIDEEKWTVQLLNLLADERTNTHHQIVMYVYIGMINILKAIPEILFTDPNVRSLLPLLSKEEYLDSPNQGVRTMAASFAKQKEQITVTPVRFNIVYNDRDADTQGKSLEMVIASSTGYHSIMKRIAQFLSISNFKSSSTMDSRYTKLKVIEEMIEQDVLTMKYKDQEGDEIAIKSDEEMQAVLDEFDPDEMTALDFDLVVNDAIYSSEKDGEHITIRFALDSTKSIEYTHLVDKKEERIIRPLNIEYQKGAIIFEGKSTFFIAKTNF
jgi:hypothetical protein